MRVIIFLLLLLMTTHAVFTLQNITSDARFLERPRLKSQVLTLNITNLLLLALLKVALVGTSYVPSPLFRRRSENEDTDDLRWATIYLWSSNTEEYDCLYRLACKDPSKAEAILSAAKKVDKVINMTKNLFPYLPKYDLIQKNMKEAAKLGKADGQVCVQKYACSSPFSS